MELSSPQTSFPHHTDTMKPTSLLPMLFANAMSTESSASWASLSSSVRETGVLQATAGIV